MANDNITADAAVAAATFVAAIRKHAWDATTLGNGPTQRMLEWKDFVDAVIVELQQLVATDGTLTVSALEAGTITGTQEQITLAGAESVDDNDFAISVGWDSGGSVVETDSAGGSTISKFHFAVLAGTTPTANPTVTFTFPTALAAAPKIVIPVQEDISTTPGGHWSVDSKSETAVVLQFVGTPEAEVEHSCSCLVVF